MSRLVILASVVALAAASANCANASGQENSVSGISGLATMVGPSALESSTLARGGGKGKPETTTIDSSTLAIEIVTDVNGDGEPNFGDHVTFNAAPSATGSFTSLNCYQGSSWVYAAGGYPSGSEFTLAANSWPGGAADCKATLYTTTDGSRSTTLATLAFHVYE